MKAESKTPTPEASQFMREMWAAEAEHPVFAGSLHNFRMLMTMPAPRRKAKRIVAAQKPKAKV